MEGGRRRFHTVIMRPLIEPTCNVVVENDGGSDLRFHKGGVLLTTEDTEEGLIQGETQFPLKRLEL